MAKLLGGKDEVEPALLGAMAEHVMPDMLEPFANSLNIKPVKYQQTVDRKANAQTQALAVLNEFHHQLELTFCDTVYHMLEKLPEWLKSGYVAAGIWKELQKHVQPELLDLLKERARDLVVKGPAAGVAENIPSSDVKTEASSTTDSKPTKKLTGLMIKECSKHLTNRSVITDVGLQLGIDQDNIDKHITDNNNAITTAAHSMLYEWMKEEEDHEEAYTKLGEALVKAKQKRTARQILDYPPKV